MMKEQSASLEKRTASFKKASKTNIVESIKDSFNRHLEFSLAKDNYSANNLDYYKSLAYSIRDKLIEKWLKSQQSYYNNGVKRIYYLSIEFLVGRMLGNALINLDLYDDAHHALRELGHNLEELQEMEIEAGLGNGGLGRLAACFLDSMATLGLPAYGYGMRYEYGIFYQKIKDGYQVETSDNWARLGNPWEIERPEHLYPVKFYGRVNNGNGVIEKREWVDTQNIMALAYDIPIPGYKNDTVINMRLWSAKSSRELDFVHFQSGDYEKAVSEKVKSETISKLLYPSDDLIEGKELRLKQEYFFVAATIQDIVRRFKKTFTGQPVFKDFPDKVAIHLNDTHPSIAIAELMRILIDIEGVKWENAWEITVKVFGYTNHTILPEAMEKWPVYLIDSLLPRHLQIIYEINHRFLTHIKETIRDDGDLLRRVSIIEEGDEKKVRMAHLAIVGSHSINGVSAFHTDILKNNVFKDFCDIWPDRFNNKTNGITQRRWLKLCNPELSELITEYIGDVWATNLYDLKKLAPLADQNAFHEKWNEVKLNNKKRLAKYVKRRNNITLNVNSIFDCQIKRIHEYKRQLLNAMHVINLYNRIKANPEGEFVPRTVIFAGKAAPSYHIAKLIIKLVNSIADVVNNDEAVGDKLKVVFMANYSVSLAELLIPAVDLSEQISTAGTEASGTGNMKACLNGAIIIGTLDGANVEIKEEIGNDNIFTFGLTETEIADFRHSAYNPWDYYHNNQELRLVIDMIKGGYFSKSEPDLFKPIVNSLLDYGDNYFVMADFESYVKCQEKVDETYKDLRNWTKMSILNTANMGKFSSDKTIMEYAKDIWDVKAV